MTVDHVPMESLLENIQNDPGFLRTVMRNFSKHSRMYPTLARDIIAIDGLSMESSEYWLAWRDAVIDLACDASDQSHLLTLIKKAVNAFCGSIQGQRSVSILADLVKIVPSSLELILKHFESSFPYWKNPQSALHLQNFAQNALNLALELPQLMERIIDFLTKKVLLIDLSIRQEDISHLTNSNTDSSDKLQVLADASSIGNLSGFGEKFSQEEKSREFEEAQKARQCQIDQVRDYLNKIDLMLLTFLQFFDKFKASSDQIREIALFILISFERHVLPSVKPKFTQFLMFYAASIDNLVADRFLGSLLAFFFTRDSQLTLTHLNNSPSKLSLFRSTSNLLIFFVKNSQSLTKNQLKNVCDLLLEWIGRKVEALTHFSQTSTEISLLATVVECFCNISPHDSGLYDDLRLEKAIIISSSELSSDVSSIPCLNRLFNSSGVYQKSPVKLSSSITHLPLSRQFLLNSSLFSI